MKKALSLFATLFALTALGAQNTQLKKGAKNHPQSKSGGSTGGMNKPVKPSSEIRSTVSQKKIIKTGVQKPFKKTKQ